VKPGDLRSNRGTIGKILELRDDGSMVVEVGDEVRTWTTSSTRAVIRERAPRGLQRAYPRALEAKALADQGLAYREIARRLGITAHAVQAMITKARQAEEDNRHRKAFG
jgi:DNA-binding CsgD family transcriptional regulator